MEEFIKILITLAVALLLAYPLISGRGVFKKLFPASGLRYDAPHNRKNIFFVLLTVLVFDVVAVLFINFDILIEMLSQVPYVKWLFEGVGKITNPQIDFIFFTLKMVIINLVFLYGYVFAKAFVKKAILDPAFGFTKKRKKKKKNKKGKDDPAEAEEQTETSEEEGLTVAEKLKKLRIPRFLHSTELDDEDTEKEAEELSEEEQERLAELEAKKKQDQGHGKIVSFFLRLFFTGEKFEEPRPWIIRVRMVLQCFIYIVEALYLIFIIAVLLSMLFPLPMGMYNFLINTLKLSDWYIYPAISVLFLQEICNFLKTDFIKKKEEEETLTEEEIEEKKLEARLRKLLGELKRNFDSEHSLRFYPETVKEEVKEYEPQSLTYKSALCYIRDRMKLYSGRVVQSYMQCLDASFSDNHVYFASSFYSELGSYLISYTYIRLLSGARVVFVVSDPAEKATLRSYLSDRLIELTGSSATNSWRIFTAEERLDQADIFIATPEDFSDRNIVSQYPDFFEEVTNAIFLDTDRMILQDSYICTLMATRLQKSTEGRIRFIFLTQHLYKGIAARSLPKFFCADPVLAFSSAKENESVSYVLWNRESKSHRIYNESGQKTTCLEFLIADLACDHDIDGVRLITDSALDHAEQKLLRNKGAEINKLYRDVVDVNYMVYSDDECNLASSIYACTRFRGQKKSVVHIISKPYLLREYFISKAATENFVNRSSFIQPRVPEHVDEHKLSLLRLFCDLTSGDGLSLTEFERRVKDIIRVTNECGYAINSAFCRKLLDEKGVDGLSATDLTAYVIAGLCDTDVGADAFSSEAAARSFGHKAKEYYLIFDPATRQSSFTAHREKYVIFNREKDILDRLFACNAKVDLCLNDEIIGQIDTFPLRTHLEYVAGQSITFNNSEYEIERISDDGKTVYLRSENVKFSHCLDTVHLRRYSINSITPIEGRLGVLNNTKLNLEEIRVAQCSADFVGETYGFYGLSSDKQTLDFYHSDGVDGNPHIASPNRRTVTDGRILKVELLSRIPCTDGMRKLLSAVFNEFTKTIFPKTYHAISVVPILTEGLPFDAENEPKTELERINALYPYLLKPQGELLESDENRITLLFINDCLEDVGAFQWFYDLSGRYMQELLANVYSYLNWLKLRPNKAHYIYFGGEALPECYDLEGCCKLLEGYNRILAEMGGKDIHTAGDDLDDELTDRCAFCHNLMETGRYSLFDNNRYICADCFEVVDDQKLLDDLHNDMRAYLSKKYPEIKLGSSKALLDPVYELTAEQVLSEYYYRVDQIERTIYTERDDPVNNVKVSLIRGIIELWQCDNALINEYSVAQLYYEELLYLTSLELTESVSWIYNALDPALRAKVDEIVSYTGIAPFVAPEVTEVTEEAEGETEAEVTDKTETEKKTEEKTETDTDVSGRTSFSFMVEKSAQLTSEEEEEDIFEGDDHYGLYDPNKMPRFLKRYFRNETAEDGHEENLSEAADDEENSEAAEGEESSETEVRVEATAEEEKKKKKSFFDIFKRKSPGEKIQPIEDDEATNPKIKVYNEIVRHAFNYSTEMFDRQGLSNETVAQILYAVHCDYPELFWLNWFCFNDTQIGVTFRCVGADGKLDVKQVNRKRQELRRAAKKFTAGISRRTDPYEALETIYRRFILVTDYDGRKLREDEITNGKVSGDATRDDSLRSLHSALVEHKVVCAGYAAAMQYLMQSVGIVSAYISSEADAEGTTHAFNVLKIGKHCCYLDATWGDWSNTSTGDSHKDEVYYHYFCTPYDEFIQCDPASIPNHTPSKKWYPSLKLFTNSESEYFRHRNAFLRSYNEEELVRIIAEAAESYNKKEMGSFQIGIRFPTLIDANVAKDRLLSSGNLSRLIGKAKETLTKKDQIALLEGNFAIQPTDTGVIYIVTV